MNINPEYKIISFDIKNVNTSISKHETVNVLKNKLIHSNKFNKNKRNYLINKYNKYNIIIINN
jgi:hypothetical protein